MDLEKRSSPEPVFDKDVECPSCKYNLRGLTEPRCPECGEVFDPQELLAGKPYVRPAGPGWDEAGVGVLRHPARFWDRPGLAQQRGPDFVSFALFAVVCGVFVGAAFAAPGAVAAGSILEGVGRCLGRTLHAGVLLWLPMILHLLVCTAVLEQAGVKDAHGAAAAVVGYSGTWLLAAGPAVVGCVFWRWHHILAGGHGWWAGPMGVVSAAVLMCASVCWAIALYKGGRAMAGQRRAGVLCALTNPFWYIGARVAYVEWHTPWLASWF